MLNRIFNTLLVITTAFIFISEKVYASETQFKPVNNSPDLAELFLSKGLTWLEMDFDNDGDLDLVEVVDGMIWLSTRENSSLQRDVYPLRLPGTKILGIKPGIIDSDIFKDIVALDSKGELYCFINYANFMYRKFRYHPEIFGKSFPYTANMFNLFDYDNDKDDDLFLSQGDSIILFQNDANDSKNNSQIILTEIPNPFCGNNSFYQLELSNPSKIVIEIFDSDNFLIKREDLGNLDIGKHGFSINSMDIKKSGTYLVKVTSDFNEISFYIDVLK